MSSPLSPYSGVLGNFLTLNAVFKVTTDSNNRNSQSTTEVILGSVRLSKSVILRNYDMFSKDS